MRAFVWRKCADCGFATEFAARERAWDCPVCNGRLRPMRRPKWDSSPRGVLPAASSTPRGPAATPETKEE